MRNIALTIMFDGSAYHGWQRQSNAISVQQSIEDAIKKITGTCRCVYGCSRTDAGVHANNYVCNFFTESNISCEKLPHALNAYLNDDISVIRAVQVDDGFNARHSCMGKEYIYKIHNSPFRNPMLNKRAWHYPYHIDTAQMQKAAALMTGKRDYSSFMAAGNSHKTTVRDVKSINIVNCGGGIIDIYFYADAFLYNMVRIMVGTMMYCAQGKIKCNDLPYIIEAADRTNAGPTAPPDGLYLNRADYEIEV